MTVPTAFPDRIAESRARHLAPAIGAIRLGPAGTIETTAHGRLSNPSPSRVTDNALWHVGSCTKAMTATLIGRLVDQGLLSFDATVADVLPHLANIMSRGFRETTVRAILTHTAGIARDPAKSTFRALRRSSAPVPAQRRFLTSEALKEQPDPTAGYSNLGYIVLGAIVEEVTGLTWESALTNEVMIPLGIGRFGFGPPGPGHPSGHRRNAHGWHVDNTDNPDAYGPAGRVHLALDEWGRVLRVHIGEGPKGFLSDATRRQLHTPVESGFAMGWRSLRDKFDLTRLHHTGSNTAWFAQALLIPERSIGVAVVCNGFSHSVEDAVGDLCNDLLSPDVAAAP